MSRQASVWFLEDDGTRDALGRVQGGVWYKPPPDFTTHFEMFRQRLALVRQLVPAVVPTTPRSDAGPKVGVIGSGYGFLVWHLWDAGFSAWGMDNAWTQSQARAGGKLPNISDHILVGDATIQADVRNVRSQAGIGSNRRFDLLITDDLLSCADSQTEAQTMLTRLRNDAMPTDRSRVIHFITCYDPTQPWSGSLASEDWLHLTESEWVTIVGTNAERIVNLSGNRIVR
jgi:hypothetical protein